MARKNPNRRNHYRMIDIGKNGIHGILPELRSSSDRSLLTVPPTSVRPERDFSPVSERRALKRTRTYQVIQNKVRKGMRFFCGLNRGFSDAVFEKLKTASVKDTSVRGACKRLRSVKRLVALCMPSSSYDIFSTAFDGSKLHVQQDECSM
jgi:hypothetical protein